MTGCCAFTCTNRSEKGFKMYRFPVLWWFFIGRNRWFQQPQCSNTSACQRQVLPAVGRHFRARVEGLLLGVCSASTNRNEFHKDRIHTEWEDHNDKTWLLAMPGILRVFTRSRYHQITKYIHYYDERYASPWRSNAWQAVQGSLPHWPPR